MDEEIHFKDTNYENKELFDSENIILKEISVSDTESLNMKIKNSRNLVLSVNNKILNANFSKLEMLIENLVTKPNVIICSETWNLDSYQYYQITGYNIYYNESKINQNDSFVMDIENNLIVVTEIVNIGKLSILSPQIKLESNIFVRTSTIYRCHNITKTKFNYNLEKYLKINRIKNTKNHSFVGDFNINILHSNIKKNEATDNTNNQEFLNNLLENEYSPCFTGITRPGDNHSGSCIDNIFIKSNTFETTSYKLTNPIIDHYTLLVNIDNITLLTDTFQNLKPI